MIEDRNEPLVPRLPRTVLVVEDEKNQRQMLTRAIREMEFDVTAVTSAVEALAHLDTAQSTVVMLDLNLPGMGGLELAVQLRKRLPAARLIVLTGYGDLDSARRAIRLEVVDFLLKPCPLGELETAVSRAYLKASELVASALPPAPETLDVKPAPLPQTQAVETIDDVERRLITEALARHNGNRTAVAHELGISVRTLYYRLARYQAENQHRSDHA